MHHILISGIINKKNRMKYVLTIMRIVDKDYIRPSVLHNSVNNGFMVIGPHAYCMVDKSR